MNVVWLLVLVLVLAVQTAGAADPPSHPHAARGHQAPQRDVVPRQLLVGRRLGKDNCPSGKYFKSNNGGSCTCCSTGRYQDKNRHRDSTCTFCPPGKYSGTCQANCASCGPGQYSPQESPGCTTCAAGQYHNLNVQYGCKNCPAGSYVTGHRYCYPCTAGRWTDQTGETSNDPGCKTCSAGKWSEVQGSNQDCKLCPAGKYSSIDQVNCLERAISTFGSKVTAARNSLISGSWGHVPYGCSVSAGGDWAAHWNFDKVYSWNTAAWALVGEMPEARDSTAKACRGSCSAGKWSNVMGSTTDEDCQLCPAGQFSNDTELTSPTECHPCSAGKYSTQLGLINDTQCLPCPAGKFSSAEGLDSEDKCSGSCSAGKFSSETGLTSNFQCLGECGPGKYSEETGLTSISNCSDCPKGSWSISNGMNFFLNFLCVCFFLTNILFSFLYCLFGCPRICLLHKLRNWPVHGSNRSNELQKLCHWNIYIRFDAPGSTRRTKRLLELHHWKILLRTGSSFVR